MSITKPLRFKHFLCAIPLIVGTLGSPFVQADTSADTTYDLLEVYQLALNNDPLIREADFNRLATSERKAQALSALLPQLSAGAGRRDSESSGSQVTFFDNDNDPTTPDIIGNVGFRSSSDAETWSLQLNQSIFNWKNWVNLGISEKQIAKADIDYDINRQELLTRVASNYFAVLAAQDVLSFEQASKTAIKRQLDQTNTRFEVGLVAITDVQEAQAAYDQAIASEIDAKRRLALAKDNLREIIDVKVINLAEPIDALPLTPPLPATEQAWIDVAQQNNLNLLTTRMDAEIARANIRSQRSDHYPTLGFSASRQGNQTDSNNAFNSSDTRGTTLNLNLNIPLYTGGNTSSRVRESVYQYRAAKERTERVSREVKRTTRDAYLNVLANISRVKALKQAVKSSQTALEATEKGFEVGTRTTVDVLNSRRSLLDAERNYSQARYDYLTNLLALKRASGNLDASDIEQINNWLK